MSAEKTGSANDRVSVSGFIGHDGFIVGILCFAVIYGRLEAGSSKEALR